MYSIYSSYVDNSIFGEKYLIFSLIRYFHQNVEEVYFSESVKTYSKMYTVTSFQFLCDF